MLANHRHALGWGDIESRVPVVIPGSAAKILLDNLLSSRESVSAAHEEIMADLPDTKRVNECLWQCRLGQTRFGRTDPCTPKSAPFRSRWITAIPNQGSLQSSAGLELSPTHASLRSAFAIM